MLVVKVLGPLEIIGDQGLLSLAGTKQRRLLVALAIRRGSVDRDVLQDDLELTWGGLRTGITRLRGVLGPESILSENHGYQLDADTVDLFEFEARLQAVRSDDGHDRTRGLQAALDMWRGPALVDVLDDEWARPVIVRLDQLRAAAEEDLAQALISAGRQVEAISLLGSNIEANPYRDRPRALLMTALAADGRRTEALRAFQDYRTLLAEDIGTEPTAELAALDSRIAAGEGAADVPGFSSTDTSIQAESRALPETARADAFAADAAGGARNLPQGFLTFLFTDIEGSSARWADDPQTMANELADHDEVLSAAIEANGGHIVKHTGDGFLAVFQQPDAAAAAALAARERLTLPVRMGLHCGTAVVRRGDYFGMCVTRTSRLMSAAHGGQTVVSQDVAPLLVDRALVDLGLHQLRGMPSTETIFQLDVPDRAADFPPLATEAAAWHNVPTPVSVTVGRAEEIAEVASALNHHRMVAIRGMGGAGKTRVAIETARQCLDTFPDGVHFIELAAVSDADLVPDTIRRSMGVRDTTRSDVSAVDALVEYCRPRRALLVLDNCEHLGDAPGLIAERLLGAAPHLHILATSRDALGVDGEHVHRVRSLAREDAIQLFIDRAVAARPSIVIDEKTREDIASICEWVDWLPLAIELTAAQAVALEPSDIRKRLRATLEMAGGRRSTVDRHRTMRTAIGWSYDSLDRQEQTVLQNASVFTGSFSLDAAESVCTTDQADALVTASVLVSLVSKSLVEIDADSRRYRLLQLVRDFATDVLAASAEPQAAHDRHAAYYHDVVAHFATEVYRGGIHVDSSDLANLRSAAKHHLSNDDGRSLIELIIAGQEYWSHVGAVADIETWLMEALETDADIPVDLHVQALASVASALTISKPRAGSAVAYGKRAVELSDSPEASQRSKFLAACELGYAYVHADASDPRGAEWLTRSLEHAGDHPLHLMRANSRLSVAAFIGNNKPAGLEPAERAVALADAAGVETFAKVARSFRAATRAVLGDRDGALLDLEQLNDLPPDYDPVWKGTVHVTAANAWLALDDQDSAKRHLVRALTVSQADVGEVIATMIASTSCTLTEVSPDLVAFTIGAVENFHSASQPMLRDQLARARDRVLSELGSEEFSTLHASGRRATLDHAHQRVLRALTGLDVRPVGLPMRGSMPVL